MERQRSEWAQFGYRRGGMETEGRVGYANRTRRSRVRHDPLCPLPFLHRFMAYFLRCDF